MSPTRSSPKTSTMRYERHQDVERAMQELKKTVSGESTNFVIGQRCIRKNELSAAAKFFEDGVEDVKKVFTRLETAVSSMVSATNQQLHCNEEQIVYLKGIVAAQHSKIQQLEGATSPEGASQSGTCSEYSKCLHCGYSLWSHIFKSFFKITISN